MSNGDHFKKIEKRDDPRTGQRHSETPPKPSDPKPQAPRPQTPPPPPKK